MMEEIIFQVIPSPEGGYEARALGYSIFTEADDWQQLKEMFAGTLFGATLTKGKPPG